MCYGMNCKYENHRGECRLIPRRLYPPDAECSRDDVNPEESASCRSLEPYRRDSWPDDAIFGSHRSIYREVNE